MTLNIQNFLLKIGCSYGKARAKCCIVVKYVVFCGLQRLMSRTLCVGRFWSTRCNIFVCLVCHVASCKWDMQDVRRMTDAPSKHQNGVGVTGLIVCLLLESEVN
jgi:hypothetical protein